METKVFFPYISLYFECYTTMPMFADAYMSSLGYLWLMSIHSRGISSTVTCRGLGKGGGGTALFPLAPSPSFSLSASVQLFILQKHDWKHTKKKRLYQGRLAKKATEDENPNHMYRRPIFPPKRSNMCW